MIFSHTVEYAIRAMTYLARQPSGTLVGAREISQAEEIPMPFLSKILQKLARQKLVRSFKGLRGGYELARPADQITLQTMLAAVDGNPIEGRCVLGLKPCDEGSPCPLHTQWGVIRNQVSALLEQTTVGDLARTSARLNRRPN